MNKKIQSQLFALILVFGTSTTVNAQITIGITEQPVQGALLQLKNIEGNAIENSTKGLGMPRVELQNMTGDLAKSLNATASVGDLDPEEHAGLLVYNVPKNPNCPAIDPGLHVWSGTEWIPLMKKDLSRIGYVTGKSGITYRTRVFGPAGEWMIDNLRETEYELPETGTLLADRNVSVNSEIKSYYFPTNNYVEQHTGVIEDDRKFYDTYPQIGLLYTADGAGNGQYSDFFGIGAGTVESTVQGICPAGWRLPSDKDWNDLEKEIATHPQLYSKSPAGSTIWSSAPGQGGMPDEDWATTFCQPDYYPNGRPDVGSNGHGFSMMLCQGAPTSNFTSKGTSLEDGFSGEWSGKIENGGLASGYGFSSFYWSSSEYDNPDELNSNIQNWERVVLFNLVGVFRSAQVKADLLSVRCKKANDTP